MYPHKANSTSPTIFAPNCKSKTNFMVDTLPWTIRYSNLTSWYWFWSARMIYIFFSHIIQPEGTSPQLDSLYTSNYFLLENGGMPTCCFQEPACGLEKPRCLGFNLVAVSAIFNFAGDDAMTWRKFKRVLTLLHRTKWQTASAVWLIYSDLLDWDPV